MRLASLFTSLVTRDGYVVSVVLLCFVLLIDAIFDMIWCDVMWCWCDDVVTWWLIDIKYWITYVWCASIYHDHPVFFRYYWKQAVSIIKNKASFISRSNVHGCSGAVKVLLARPEWRKGVCMTVSTNNKEMLCGTVKKTFIFYILTI